jgi:hypothetical protein
LTRAGVGVSGADYNASYIVAWQALLADAHWCGAHAILREYTRSRCRKRADYKREIGACRIRANAAMQSRETVTARYVPLIDR